MNSMLYKIVVMISLSLAIFNYISNSNSKMNFDNVVEIEITEEIDITNQVKDLEDFLNDISFRESSGRYDIINSYGYLGKYQFSPHLLWKLGFRVTKDEFLSNPRLQHEAMLALLNHNNSVMESSIKEFDGATFEELIIDRNKCYMETYTVTKSGILAAAHLIGPYRTRLFLEERIDSSDGYGTQMTEYLYSFSGYNLNL